MRLTFTDLPDYPGVLVDGSFDPLHAGHISYIHTARALAKGPLLCAVASDDYIRRKGREPLLPQASRVAVVEALGQIMAVYLKDRPTHEVLEQMKPAAYVKGADWRGKLPPEQVEVCHRLNIPILFVDTLEDSSTARLKAWALADADTSLDRLTAVMASQTETPAERYDADYFQGDWRTTTQPYTLDGRRMAEGMHPQILADVFPRQSMLDVGCGPGFLVELLRERGVEAGGIDPSPAAKALAVNRWVIQGYPANCPDKMADVVICREVIEHLSVNQITEMVADLFRLAKRVVYITTRFSADSVFDCATKDDLDPTHISMLSQPFLRSLCVLNGGTRRRDWEQELDHGKKGRVLCYEL